MTTPGTREPPTDEGDVARAIAANVRRARTAAGWTLDELAARAGASKGVVVQIEQGRANPSIGTLLKVADGLGVPLARLLEQSSPAVVTVFPAARAPRLEAGPDGRLTLLAGIEWIAGSHAELWDWSLERGGVHRSDAHRPGTSELVHVRKGTLELRVAAQRHRIEEGSTVHLVADVPHEYANAGRGRLLMDMVVLEPGGPPDVRG
jgi:transcriptional regulator with XRE-family HTH domain